MTIFQTSVRVPTPKGNRLYMALLLAGVSLGATTQVSARTNEELQERNQKLEEENTRLRLALERAGLSTDPTASAQNRTSPSAPSTAAAKTVSVAQHKSVSVDEELQSAIIVAAERLKLEPESVSAVTGEELEKFHVNNFRDMVNRIGNVRTSWNNPNTASIFVRGVGWAAGAGVLDPSVGVSVDDVSHGISSISALSNYLDIETVEVVRGPTGTDGLKATNLGRVAIHTRRPSFSPEARASVTYGERNTVIATAAVGGGIIADTLAYRLTINRETADGPYKNLNDSHYSWRNTDRTNARAQILFTPSSKFEAILALDYTPTGREICENCFWFNTKTPEFYDWNDRNGNPGQVNYAEDAYGKLQRRWFTQKDGWKADDYYAQQVNTLHEYPNTYATKGVSANLLYRLSDTTTIKSITGWRDYQFSQGAGSHTPFEWLRAPRGTQTSFEQWSQEFRVDSRFSDTLTYRGGLYYYDATFPNYSQTERYGSDGGAYYANAAQYATLDREIPGVPGSVDAAGRLLLFNSIHGLITQRKERYENKSAALYSNILWDVTPTIRLNGGIRITHEKRRSWAENGILADGYAAELNPASVNNVTLNGFRNNAAGALTADNNAAQLALADLVASKYFGIASYAGLNDVQRAQVAAAKAIRAGRIGGLYQLTEAEKYSETLFNWEGGLSWQVTPDHRLHLGYKHGEKPGISQIVGATALGGKSLPAGTEKTDAYELGLRSILFDRDLTINATLFLQDIKDYIQPAFVYDPVQTELNNNGSPAYISALGNVPKVRTKGLELDVAFFGIPYTTIRFAGAYTDARYRSFPRATNPAELGGSNPAGPYYDASGKRLAGAPKFSGNLFADISYPIGHGTLLLVHANYNFQSSYNTNTGLSRYTVTDFQGVTDLSLGLGTDDGRFAIKLVAKNAFNVETGINPAWNQYKPGIPRWLGVTVSASLY